MKQFHSTVKAKAEEETGEVEPLQFSIGDETFESDYCNSTQATLVVASFGISGSEGTRASLAFLKNHLRGDGYKRIMRMLENGELELETLLGTKEQDGVITWIIQESAQRPTEPSKSSSTSSGRGGRKSTAN